MRWLAAVLVPMLVVTLGVACEEGEEEPGVPASGPAAITTATSEATRSPETDPWLKIVASGQTQTREGLSITLEGVAIGTAERVLADMDTSRALLGDDWTHAEAVIGVILQVHNPTANTITVPIYTNTRIVANDEQVGIDFLLSDVEVSILSGVREDMQVIAPISRYSAEDIETVRFVLEMSVLASPEETFDFTVAIP